MQDRTVADGPSARQREPQQQDAARERALELERERQIEKDCAAARDGPEYGI